MQLSSQDSDSVLSDLSDQVNNPSDEVAYTGEGAQQTDNQGDDVLGFEETDDAVDTTDDTAQNQLQQDLNDLGQALVGFSNLHNVLLSQN